MCAYWPSSVMPAASGTSTISATAISTRAWPAWRRGRASMVRRAATFISTRRFADDAVLALTVQLAVHAVDAHRLAARADVRVGVAQVLRRATLHRQVGERAQLLEL